MQPIRKTHGMAIDVKMISASLAALNVNHHPLAVDVADFQVCQLGVAHSDGVERHQHNAMVGSEHVLQYLGRYTHRVVISNHRLVSFAEEKVTFRWRDSAHNNEQKLLTLSLDEFLRRFLLHVLPKGFVRIRNFGFLANRRRATLLPLCFHLLGSAPDRARHLRQQRLK